MLVFQNTAFTAHPFGNQHPGTGNASGVKLPEFHVFQRNAGTCRHAHAVAGIDERIGTSGPDTPGTASSKNGGLGFQNHDFAGFHFVSHDTHDITVSITHQVERHPLDKKLGTGTYIALVQGMQQGMTGTVSGSTSTRHRLFTEVSGVPTKRALVNRTIRVTIKRHAKVFQLIDHFRRLTTHEFNCVLVTQVV